MTIFESPNNLWWVQTFHRVLDQNEPPIAHEEEVI